MPDELSIVALPSETRQVRRSRERAARKPNGDGGEASRPSDLGIEPDACFNLTDSGNAEYFAARHGRDLRYDHRRGSWLIWCEHRWTSDADGEVYRLAKGTVRQRFRDAADADDPDARGRAAKWAITSESHARIDAMLALAQAEHPLTTAGDRWDADPWLLAAPNGIVDLRTGERRPGRREDQITLGTGVPFFPDAVCPRWERVVREIFAGEEALAGFFQRAVGYSLTGLTTEQCLFLCHGTGANGKSTLLNTLKRLLGDYAHNMPFSTVEMRDRGAIPNDVAALAGRRFVVASESNDGARLNESRLKALTGSDPVTARFLHREFFTFEPVAKFWFAVNHRPVVRDDSHGFWRRLRLIPFARTFPVDPTLPDALLAEAPGILAWAVRGCLAWQHAGLSPPEAVTAATDTYARDSDVLADFIDEALEPDAEAEVRAAQLYGHYLSWAKAQDLGDRERLTSTAFGRKMGERVPSHRVGGVKRYVGISRRAW